MELVKSCYISCKNSVNFLQFSQNSRNLDVENVLLIIGMNQKDPSSILSPEYYHIIIERAKVFKILLILTMKNF